MLDYKSRLPIYQQLYNDITRKAALGVIEPGESLPSVRSVAEGLGINPNTVQKSYQMLERNGIICSVPGKGSFLSSDISAITQQQKIALEALDKVLRSTVDCGIAKAKIISHVNNIFNGRSGEE